MLGVTLPTLYAYTSRGQLRSAQAPGRPRERRYFREDIERLLERKETRKDPARAAARGLHWGSPVLSSGITLIEDGKLYYRGQDAVKLSTRLCLEDIAGLLWSADRLFDEPPILSARPLTKIQALSTDPLVRMQAALALAGEADLAAYDLRPPAVRQAGARILRLLTSVAAKGGSQAQVHRALQAAWAPGKTAAAEAIRIALVLCADHELNVSAFTARCAASAGATPYDTVAAAMATLKGRRHGGETARVASLVAETKTPRRARTVVADWMRRGEKLPGFGHPLYPAGDPRAVRLMQAAQEGGNRTERSLARAVANAAGELLHELPNLDFGLVALARVYGLPAEAPLILFALGRTVGWIAHALEQYESDELIRPRASYSGPVPASLPE